MRYSVPIKGGETVRLPYIGKFLLIVDTGKAPSVTLTLMAGPHIADLGNVRDGFPVDVATGFDVIELGSAVDTTVDLLITPFKIDADFGSLPYTATNTIIANIGAPQLLLPANANRKKLRILNTDATNTLVLNNAATGTVSPVNLHPDDFYEESDIAHLELWGLCAAWLTDNTQRTSIIVQELLQ
jgi:hypothetical protein